MPRIRDKVTGEIIYVPDTPQPWIGKPADPTFDLKEPQARANLSKTQADIDNDRRRLAHDAERLAIARAASQRADTAEGRAGKMADMAVAERTKDRDLKLAQLRAMENQIGRVRQLYRQGPGATKGFMAGALDYLPTPQNEQFNTASAGLGELGMAAFRVPGVGSQSDTELRAFVEANKPSASNYDATIEEKIRNLENRLSETYKAYGVQYRPRGGVANAPRKPSSKGWKVERIND